MNNPRRPLQILFVVAAIAILALSAWNWRHTGQIGAGSAVGLMLLVVAAIIGNRPRRPRGHRPDQP